MPRETLVRATMYFGLRHFRAPPLPSPQNRQVLLRFSMPLVVYLFRASFTPVCPPRSNTPLILDFVSFPYAKQRLGEPPQTHSFLIRANLFGRFPFFFPIQFCGSLDKVASPTFLA